MTDQAAVAPTDDEIAAAQAVFARKAAADQIKIDAAAPAVKAMIADASFSTMFDAATALRGQLPDGSVVDSHLKAIVTGMTNLRNYAAVLPA